MSKIKRIVPIVLFAGALFVIPGCAEHVDESAHEVTNDTGSTVGSVLDGVGSVVMYPFHVVSDIL
jgi:hypothetical protein